MKILNDKDYGQLHANATAFAAIVTAMVEASEGVDPAEITSESIVAALQANADTSAIETALAEAQTQLTEAQTLLTAEQTALQTANDRIIALEAEVKTLGKLPASNPAGIKADGEPAGEEMTIAQFADKNKGNTEAILAMAVKEGLL